jgi:exopolysaccharide production protein ExoZ
MSPLLRRGIAPTDAEPESRQVHSQSGRPGVAALAFALRLRFNLLSGGPPLIAGGSPGGSRGRLPAGQGGAMRTIVSVQALRALAALSVVLCHFNFLGLQLSGRGDDPIPLYSFASGVDLFFVISGFIMVYSSEDLFGAKGAWRIFLRRRLFRIVPLYWATTVFLFIVLMHKLDVAHVLKSLLFIPYESAAGFYPVHGVGWTLNFEMFFYVLFAAAIFLPKGSAVAGVSLGLLCLVAFGRIWQPQGAVLFWSDPIVIEFIFGMVIALVYGRIELHGLVRACLMFFGMTAVWFSAPSAVPSGYRVLLWGVPAAMIFAGAVLGKQPDFGRLTAPAKLMGNASYALYLIHPLATAMILAAWRHGLDRIPMMIALSLGYVGVIFSSIAIWRIERSLKNSASKFWVNRRAALAA